MSSGRFPLALCNIHRRFSAGVVGFRESEQSTLTRRFVWVSIAAVAARGSREEFESAPDADRTDDEEMETRRHRAKIVDAIVRGSNGGWNIARNAVLRESSRVKSSSRLSVAAVGARRKSRLQKSRALR